jgi:hypothetical protein
VIPPNIEPFGMGWLRKWKKKKKSWRAGRRFTCLRGRLTLIKSTLSSIPTYFLSLLPLPAGIASRLERFKGDFLWDNLGGDDRLHLVN